MPLTRVYIDGFNLYHGIIRKNRLHWLDLEAFAQSLNQGVAVEKVIYCTAMVSGNPDDADKPIRQDIYHRALSIYCPAVEIIKGQFTSHNKFQPVANCASLPTCLTKVVVRNEKGSDVNLAARLLHDAHLDRFERAIVISGDSDLTEPIRLVTTEIGKTVWVRNPRDVSSQELSSVASDYARLRPSMLSVAQLPNVVTDGSKTYSKPTKWKSQGVNPVRTDILAIACPETGCEKQIKTCQYR